MDLYKVIRRLYEELDKLDRVIASLEQLQRTATEVTAEPPKKRRGRKFMDEAARKEVSERMRKYWANRRKNNPKGSSQGS
jgi:hypothetical protein